MEDESALPSSPERTVAAFDVEDDNSTRGCYWLFIDLVHVLLPFLLLTEHGARRRSQGSHPFFNRMVERLRNVRPVLPRAPNISKFFLMLLLFVLLINAGVVYMFLSISSMTQFMQMGEDGRRRNITLKPRIGEHWSNATMGKYILQIIIINYLCWQVLEHDPKIAKMRLQDPLHLNKPGLIHGLRKLASCLFCYPYKEIWLSTQFIDHMLLTLTGFPYAIVQPMLACIHIELRDNGIELQGALQGDWLMLLSGALGLYSGFLMVGFLCVTLGNGVRPRSGYSYVFQLSTFALAILMALEFLVQQQARQRYSQFHLKADVGVIWYYNATRVFMSASQLFATHSLCMLCAMHLGHAQHFQKCPDLPWSVACKEALSWCLFMVIVTSAGYCERVGHLWPLCESEKFMIGAIWECSLFGLHIVLGITFLACGLQHSTEVIQLATHADWKLVPAAMKLFDLDSFMILVTFIAASGHSLVEIYDLYAERLYTQWMLQILHSAFNLGIAVFTFACWKQPPLRGWTRRCLWLILAVVAEDFLHFQLVEDCEFASAMPGCCSFPSPHDVNAEGGHTLWKMCALDHRCAYQNPASSFDNHSYFCKLSEEFFHHGHGHQSHGSHGHESESEAHGEAHQSQSDTHGLWADQRGAVLPIRASCTELKRRWLAFPDELKIEESSEHEESFSAVFKQLKLIGNAGNIEFKFAVIGILLKVILFVEHPNSDRILELRHQSTGH